MGWLAVGIAVRTVCYMVDGSDVERWARADYAWDSQRQRPDAEQYFRSNIRQPAADHRTHSFAAKSACTAVIVVAAASVR